MRLHIVLLLFLGIASLATAQDTAEIVIEADETITVSVSADAPAQVIYQPETVPQYIMITAESANEAFDPVVWVIDAEDRLRAYNNNVEGTQAQINNLLLSEDGYTIYVDSFNGVSTADVELTITVVDPFEETITEENLTTEISFTLLEDTIYAYTFQATTEQTITITAQDVSGLLDPFLQITDASGEVITHNDDHASADLTLDTLDARISDWRVPAGGLYTIEIIDFLGRSGEILLTMTIEE